MYTRRAAAIPTFRSLFKVCRTATPDFSCPASLRNLTSVAQASDFDDRLSGGVSGDCFDSSGLGGDGLYQNPTRVYSPTVNSTFGAGKLDFSAGNDLFNQKNRLDGSSDQLNAYSENLDMQRSSHSPFHTQVSFNGYSNANGGNNNISWKHLTNSNDFYHGNSSNEVSEERALGVETLDEFIRDGKLKDAVECLVKLKEEGTQIELPRYMALMVLCGEKEVPELAKSVYEHLLQSLLPLEVRTYNRVLEMFVKCGSPEDMFSVFDRMPTRNLTTWDIMISGLAKNGLGEESIELYDEFKRCGLKPDGQMFLGVFSACGVLCDIVEGMLHFESMTKDYGIFPTMDHYVGIVGMLASAGCMDEALEFIENMPVEPAIDVWETLMNFSRMQGNLELGDRCAEIIETLDLNRLNDKSREGLIPLDDAELAKEKEKKKLSAQNPLDVRSRVHEYRAGDRSHPDHERIYELLRCLKQQMKEAGYIPDTKFVLHDVDPESKEEALMAHSERLAAAQGFMTSAARSSLRIIKNLRVCGDCHNAFKILSKIVGREIIARDAKRFHHFKNGSCSCNDYW